MTTIFVGDPRRTKRELCAAFGHDEKLISVNPVRLGFPPGYVVWMCNGCGCYGVRER